MNMQLLYTFPIEKVSVSSSLVSVVQRLQLGDQG